MYTGLRFTLQRQCIDTGLQKQLNRFTGLFRIENQSFSLGRDDYPPRTQALFETAVKFCLHGFFTNSELINFPTHSVPSPLQATKFSAKLHQQFKIPNN